MVAQQILVRDGRFAWYPRDVGLYDRPLVPLYTMAPLAATQARPAPPPQAPVASAQGGVSPGYDLPVASPMQVTVLTGNLGPDLPLSLDVDRAEQSGPEVVVDYLQRTAQRSAGQRGCDFTREGIRADGRPRPLAYGDWQAVPAYARPQDGKAAVYWVQLNGPNPDERCLAYRQVLETGESAEPARANVENVLTGLAAMGARPELAREPNRRTVRLDARQYLDLVDLL